MAATDAASGATARARQVRGLLERLEVVRVVEVGHDHGRGPGQHRVAVEEVTLHDEHVAGRRPLAGRVAERLDPVRAVRPVGDRGREHRHLVLGPEGLGHRERPDRRSGEARSHHLAGEDRDAAHAPARHSPPSEVMPEVEKSPSRTTNAWRSPTSWIGAVWSRS